MCQNVDKYITRQVIGLVMHEHEKMPPVTMPTLWNVKLILSILPDRAMSNFDNVGSYIVWNGNTDFLGIMWNGNADF